MKPTLLLYCQHSVGIGHLTRSFALAAALALRYRVVFLNGGPIPAGIPRPIDVEFIDLQPLGTTDGHDVVARAGDGAHDAQATAGSVESVRCARRDRVLRAFRELSPEVLLVELFPFGRKKFAFELLPLLKAARRAERTLVVSSLRDLLVASRRDQQHHDDRAEWLCRRYFDAVLVHADARVARLEDTFRPRRTLTTPVHYTGFVVPARATSPTRVDKEHSILVSAGGGLVGGPLLRTALEAHAAMDPGTRPRLDLIAGPFLPEDEWADLERRVGELRDVRLERSVPDLAARMARAGVSLSQCGYNTALDIVVAGVRALVVPYAEGREDEQTNRARRFAELGLLRWLPGAELTPLRLRDELLATFAFEPRPGVLDLDGSERSANIIAALQSATRAPAGIVPPIDSPWLESVA